MRTTISLKNDVSMPVAAGLLLTVALSFFLCHRFVDQAAGNMARSVGERRGIVQAMALLLACQLVGEVVVTVMRQLAPGVAHDLTDEPGLLADLQAPECPELDA